MRNEINTLYLQYNLLHKHLLIAQTNLSTVATYVTLEIHTSTHKPLQNLQTNVAEESL